MKLTLCLILLLPLSVFSQTFTGFDLNQNGDISAREFTEANGLLYFAVEMNTGNETGLWVTDGTFGNTGRISAAVPGGNTFLYYLTELNGKLIFRAERTPQDPIFGIELWISDGTPSGTRMLLDIHDRAGSSSPRDLIVFGNELFFTADDGVHGRELWKTDGTPSGTVMVKDINPGIPTSNPSNFAVVGSTLFFSAFEPQTGIELWKTNGTESGTLLVKDIDPGNLGSSLDEMTAVGNQLFFVASTVGSGRELWTSDGTSIGTKMTKEIYPGATGASIFNVTAFQGKAYFAAKSDTHGFEPWVSDGTTPGTQMVKDIFPGSGDSFAQRFYPFKNWLYFAAADGPADFELWRTDGTDSGTSQFKDLWPGNQSGNPADFIGYHSNLYFTAFTATMDRQLFQSDGTSAGTIQIEPGSATRTNPLDGFTFEDATVYNGELYFLANYDPSDRELWKYQIPPTAIDLIAPFSNLTIYPNPTEGDIFVDLGERVDEVEIKISNVLGKVVFQQFYSNTKEIEVSCEGPAGIYFVSVSSDKKYAAEKIIKN